jgi:hypothetical protein
MFAMSAATRILLCRLGCIAFCLAPTTFVGGWTCWRRATNYAVAQREDWERALASRTGLVVEIGSVSYPAPSLARLDDLKFLDPESARPLAAAAACEVFASANGWRVELWQPTIQSEGCGELARVVNDRLLRTAPGSLAPLEVASRELTIVRGRQAQSLLDFAARYAPASAGPEIACEFRLPDASAAHIRLSCARNRQLVPPATLWQLDTAGQALPCDLLAEFLPGAARLGAACRFTGAASLVSAAGEWSGQAAGRLAPLDLDSLVTEQFPHQLSGLATLDLERLTIGRGRLTGLRGTLRASHGALSPSLVAAAEEQLQLTAGLRTADERTGLVPFQQLAIRFRLDDRTLALAGHADRAQPGVLAASARGPILSAPEGHSVASVSLLRLLLPDSQFQVPATRQTSALVQLLPVPDLITTARAHTPARLAPTPAATPHPAIREPMVR